MTALLTEAWTIGSLYKVKDVEDAKYFPPANSKPVKETICQLTRFSLMSESSIEGVRFCKNNKLTHSNRTCGDCGSEWRYTL